MYKIYVENIRCYSYHGCLEEETVIGGNYVVDVVVDLKNSKLSGNDDLNETIDYCDVTNIVKDVICLLYTSPSPRDYAASRMPSSA